MFTTYSASAGSGKTTHLVADFLSLCFRIDSRNIAQGDSKYQLDLYQRILAITFTNNASKEMKDRVVDTLRTFAFDEKDSFNGSAAAIYSMVVEALFGTNPKLNSETIWLFMKNESRELLRRIVFDYARFTISTIDSFFQRVIRSSALTLNLNLNFSVQIDMDEFYIQAIDQLLNELSAESDLARRVVFLLDNAMEDSGKSNVDAELEKALKMLYEDAEKNYEYLQILNRCDEEELKQFIRSLRQNIHTIPDKLKAIIKPITEEGNQWMTQLNLTFQKNKFNNWFEAVQNDPIAVFNAEFDEWYGAQGKLFKKTKISQEEQDRIDTILPHIVDCFNRVTAEQKKLRPIYLDSMLRNKHADKLLMLTDLREKMQEIKLQNNLFILNESNALVYKTIKERGFETIFDRVKFENFFIDEFQDTSKMQWDNLKPIIINNALSQFERQVSLFGDVKQAIYRFRNGDADLFYNLLDYNRLQKDKDLKLVDADHFQQIPLDTNYRSLQAVVTFNNQFFDYYAAVKGLDKYYREGLVQQVHKNQEGLVQMFFSNNDKDKVFLKKSKPVDSDFLRKVMEDETITVRDMEVLCAVMDARKRGYQDGEIAVLYSGNDNCVKISNIMLKLGWNVVTEKSLCLNVSPEVNVIIATLQYLLHPEDRMAQSEIIYYLTRLKGKADPLKHYFPKLQNQGIFDSILSDEIGKTIPRESWLSEPLFLMIKDIIAFYDFQKQSSPFLVDFENLVLNYLSTKNGDLSKFLIWWKQQEERDKLPSLSLPTGQNAIRVGTIHKSKGLEYPVVILPYNQSKGNKPIPVWDKLSDRMAAFLELTEKTSKGSSYEERCREERERLETDALNLLYVAHTRACDMLYIITNVHKGENTAYGDCLRQFVSNLDLEADPEDERFFYYGDKEWNKQKKNAASFVISPRVMPEMRISDFKLEDVSVAGIQESFSDDPRAEGTFVHDFLSRLTDFPQTQEAFEQVLGGTPEERKPRLREAFKNIMEDESLRPCFASGVNVLNEITIMGSDKKEHRPDRIVFLDDRVVVIDYKTGSPHPQYQKQIDEYCALLRNMGYENVEGKLLFV